MGLQAGLQVTYGLTYTKPTDDLLISFRANFGSESYEPDEMLREENWDMDKLEKDFPDLGVATCYRNSNEAYFVVFAGDFTTLAQDSGDMGSDIFPYRMPKNVITDEEEKQLVEFSKRYPSDGEPTWLLLGSYA